MDEGARQLLDWVDGRPTAPRHDQVEDWLGSHRWTPCGEGDWARAYRSPDGRFAARVSPFDPACPMTVALYREGAGNRYLPRLHAHRPLDGGGCLMLLDYLTPVAAAEASGWHQRLRDEAAASVDRELAAGGADRELAAGGADRKLAAGGADRELAAAAALIEQLHRRAEAALPWCGPLDHNPGNVMRGSNGQITFVDLFYVQGRVLYAKALDAPAEVVAAIPAGLRRHMFDIPAIAREASAEEIARMRSAIAEADAVEG